MSNANQKSNTEYSPRSGVVIRPDLTLYVWCEDDGIEVILSPDQAIDLALSILGATGEALRLAKQQAKDSKCPN